MDISFKYLLVFVTLLMVLSSCVKEVDIDYPNYEPQIVLTGLMQPDSVIKIRLQKTQSVLSAAGTYPFVSDADVFCYENNKKIGQLKHDNNGFYRLNYFPKQGATYRIEVLYDNKIITAEDDIPYGSDLTITMGAPNYSNPNQNLDLFLKVSRSNLSYTWLSAILSYQFGGEPRIKGAVIVSSFPIFDTFNAYKSLSGVDSFEDYARLKPDFLGNYNFKFTVGNQLSNVKTKGDIFYFQVSDLSKNYDRYLKSSLTAYQNSPEENGAISDPFAEPISIFSNVKNGVGILGAMQTRRIILKIGH